MAPGDRAISSYTLILPCCLSKCRSIAQVLRAAAVVVRVAHVARGAASDHCAHRHRRCMLELRRLERATATVQTVERCVRRRHGWPGCGSALVAGGHVLLDGGAPQSAAEPFHGDSRGSLRASPELLSLARVEELCVAYDTSAFIRDDPRQAVRYAEIHSHIVNGASSSELPRAMRCATPRPSRLPITLPVPE